MGETGGFSTKTPTLGIRRRAQISLQGGKYSLASCLWVPSRTLGVGLDPGLWAQPGGVSPSPSPDCTLPAHCLLWLPSASWRGFPSAYPAPPATTRDTPQFSGARLTSASGSHPRCLFTCQLPALSTLHVCGLHQGLSWLGSPPPLGSSAWCSIALAAVAGRGSEPRSMSL